jgi:hypothetical protein
MAADQGTAGRIGQDKISHNFLHICVFFSMHGLYLARMLNFRYLDPFGALAGRPGFLIDTRAHQRAEKDITTFDNTILLKRFSDHFWHLELTQPHTHTHTHNIAKNLSGFQKSARPTGLVGHG